MSASLLSEKLELRLRDASPAVVIASACVLGLECEAIRVAGGYHHRGSHWRYRDAEGVRRKPWDELVLNIAGICSITAANYFKAAQALIFRFESENGTEHAELLETMRHQQPSELSARERSALVDGIAAALTDSDTLMSLVDAGRTLHAKGNADDPPPGEDVMDIPEKPLPATDGTIELMAVELGIDPARARRIALEVLDLLGDGSLYGKRKKHGKKGKK